VSRNEQTKRPVRRYGAEFKQDAVRRMGQGGTVTALAKRLGMHGRVGHRPCSADPSRAAPPGRKSTAGVTGVQLKLLQ
jgi:hypothetical protein